MRVIRCHIILIVIIDFSIDTLKSEAIIIEVKEKLNGSVAVIILCSTSVIKSISVVNMKEPVHDTTIEMKSSEAFFLGYLQLQPNP